LSRVAACQTHFEFASELQQAAKEAIDPVLWQVAGQSQGEEHSQWHSTHGSDIAESTRQAAMPDAFRRVPVPSEMDILQAEIGSNQGLMTARNWHNRTVIADPKSSAKRCLVRCGGLATKAADQGFLRQGHEAFNIQVSM
jgi:hypothetical protein